MRAPLLISAVLALAVGCASPAFEDAPAADPAALPTGGPQSLADLTWREYYTGVVFNGQKIGFSHLRVTDLGDGRYRLESDATMALRVLGLDKRIVLKAVDEVDAELRLRRFTYDYLIDDASLRLDGEVASDAAGHVLDYRVVAAGDERREQLRFEDAPLPMSALYLAPTLQGLAVGRSYSFASFSGELQAPVRVTQRVEAYEDSPLFLVRDAGPGFRIVSDTAEQEVVAWIAQDGRPLLERSLGGVIFSGLEPEAMARRYLTESALSKDETLMDFALVTDPDVPASPRGAGRLVVRLEGLPEDWQWRDGAGQRCARTGEGVTCTVLRGAEPGADLTPAERAAALESTLAAPMLHPRIQALAQEIGAGAGGAAARSQDRTRAVLAWIEANVTPSAQDVFSAIDVLDGGRAECQGHSYLYTALARALGVPTRVVNGLVWSPAHGGFLYHTWAESLVDTGWIAVDPTFRQYPADAGRIRLLDGEGIAALLPLTMLLGRIEADVLEVDP